MPRANVIEPECDESVTRDAAPRPGSVVNAQPLS